ncbi:MAG TPA: hypothetical protein VES96_02785 [Nitrospiraceae bacterium]|nr:hypothetical protein [Nitrospiraceae bacterium]
MMTMRFIAVMALAVLLAGAASALAYEEITVRDGGTLTGRVTLSGKVPKPKGYNLTTLPDPLYCGRISDGQGWRILQPFQVGPAGEFREVVVYLEGISAGKPFDEGGLPQIEATVVNMDPVMHAFRPTRPPIWDRACCSTCRCR